MIHVFFEHRNPATPQSSLSESIYQLTLPVVSNQPHSIVFLLFSLHKECGIGTWRLWNKKDVFTFIFNEVYCKKFIHFLFQSHRMQCCTVQRKLSAICLDPLSSYGWQPIYKISQSERSCHLTGCRYRRPIYMVPCETSWCYGGKHFLTGNGDYGKVWHVPSARHLSCISCIEVGNSFVFYVY